MFTHGSVQAGTGVSLPVTLYNGAFAGATGPTFSFNAPVLFELSPLPVPYYGGIVTVTGENFGLSAQQVSVLLDSVVVQAQVLTMSNTELTIALPGGEYNHLFQLRVGPPGYTSTTAPLSFYYDLPPFIGMCE